MFLILGDYAFAQEFQDNYPKLGKLTVIITGFTNEDR